MKCAGYGICCDTKGTRLHDRIAHLDDRKVEAPYNTKEGDDFFLDWCATCMMSWLEGKDPRERT